MKLPRLVMLTALATAAVMVSSGSAYAAHDSFGHHASFVVGHAYVDDNTAVSNTVAGFDRHADGSLTPIPGSPFSIGGAGSGAGLPSQGAIQLSSDGRYLLAVDAKSNQISVLRLGFNGVPQPVGSPVSSGGIEPLSIAVSGNLVYVANSGSEPNVTGFLLSRNGALYPLPGSTVSLPAGSGPDDVLFDPRGHKLVVDLDNTSSIASFHVRRDGLLVAAPGSPIAGQGFGPFGAEFRPTNPSQLFVSNAHNVGAGTGTVSAFLVAGSGQLAPIGASPFADLQTAPCWVEISHDGQFLFTVNTGSGEISSYSINPDGSLVLLGSTPFGSAGAGAVDARLSPDGKTLLVDGSKAGVIASFAVSGGSLTELASSPTPLPAGAFAAGIVTN
jgi:6-phosphogluconolactonase